MAPTRFATRAPGSILEAPLSKQVLVFTDGDKPFAIYPISSGKPSTPTVTGHFSFLRTEPGYNSHGMYYSFYFYGGYAVHGYESVPNYAASHGCIRTFIADQAEIFKSIFTSRDIFVFLGRSYVEAGGGEVAVEGERIGDAASVACRRSWSRRRRSTHARRGARSQFSASSSSSSETRVDTDVSLYFRLKPFSSSTASPCHRFRRSVVQVSPRTWFVVSHSFARRASVKSCLGAASWFLVAVVEAEQRRTKCRQRSKDPAGFRRSHFS